jgi:hypothetical protein
MASANQSWSMTSNKKLIDHQKKKDTNNDPDNDSHPVWHWDPRNTPSNQTKNRGENQESKNRADCEGRKQHCISFTEP